MKRKLVTIFAADVAEYSRHMHEDEDRTLTSLLALRRIMDPIIDAHGGRIANTAGDSVVAEFDSPTNAVRAATQIQTAHQTYNKTRDPRLALQFRIGLNLGDVAVQEDGDLLGDGVNVAARLQALADPGGICLAENVYGQVHNRLDVTFSKLGEHHVKNIAAPIKVFAITNLRSTFAKRAERSLKRVIHSPLSLAAILGVASLALGIALWRPAADRPKELSLRGRTTAEVLSQFDLVAEGNFEGRKYYLIRTWGVPIKEQSAIATALGGHVAVIDNAAENQFLFELSRSKPGFWFDDGGQAGGPQIGLVQDDGATEPDGGWRWTTGEMLSFNAWKVNGPDNSGGGQNLAAFRNHRGNQPAPTWDDIRSERRSFFVEVPSQRRPGN